ncbi:MAG: DUF5615 family PIN-like protein [Desulfococcaceae bacterium]
MADENISPRVVSFLRQKGTDVIDTKEEKWHGKDDGYLLEKAFTDNRFILTMVTKKQKQIKRGGITRNVSGN